MKWKDQCILFGLLACLCVVLSHPCERIPVKLLVTYDITLGDGNTFNIKRGITEEILRHMDAVVRGRDINYGFVAYHSHAVVLSSLKSNKSASLDSIVAHLHSVRPRPGIRSSVGKGLNAAIDHIAQNTNSGGRNVIILVHGGESDNIDNLVMAIKRLWALNIDLFVVSDPAYLYLSTLMTKNRKHVFSDIPDFPVLLKEIDSSIGTCLDDVQPNGVQRSPDFELRPFKTFEVNRALENTSCFEESDITFLNILENGNNGVPINFLGFLGIKNVVTIDSSSDSVAHIIQEQIESHRDKESVLIILNQKTSLSPWDEILETYASIERSGISLIVGYLNNSVKVEMNIYTVNKGFLISDFQNFFSVIHNFVKKCKGNGAKEMQTIKGETEKKMTTQSTEKPIISTTATTTTTTAKTQTTSRVLTTLKANSQNSGDVSKCIHASKFFIVIDPNINNIMEFEKRRNTLLELVISMPKTIQLMIAVGENNFTNEKEVLLSTISSLKLDEIKASNPVVFLKFLSHNSSIIYIDGTEKSLLDSEYFEFDDFVVITSTQRVSQYHERYKQIDFDYFYTLGSTFYSEAFKCLNKAKKPKFDGPKRHAKSAKTSETINLKDHSLVPIATAIDDHRMDECRTDVIFVLDTSQSVENSFQEQLQIIANFLANVPDADFKHRVKVGLVTFNNEADTVLDLSEFRTKEEIITSVLSVEHTGGPTSLVKGIEETLKLIRSTGRLSSRLAIVLVSDGNSQDEWDKVLLTSNALQKVNGEVFAVTVSEDYFLRELQLYTGSKETVYVEGRLPQFLSALSGFSASCGPSEKTVSHETIVSYCPDDLVDLMLIVDTNSSDLSSLKRTLVQFVKSIDGIGKRVHIALAKASSETGLVLGFRDGISHSDIVFEIEKLSPSTDVSLVSAVNLAVNELLRSKRESRKLVVIMSNGDNKYESDEVTTGMRLQDISDSIYVYGNGDKLRAYLKDGNGIVSDSESLKKELLRELQCFERVKVKPSIDGLSQFEAKDTTFPQVEAPISEINECTKNKMDLILILDASTSRENVFEHQRELALSLIERLPISKFDTHVAIGINSFNEEATLSQSLSAGRDRDMVRESIEKISYIGGSTYTSKAITLALEDLQRNGRKDSTKVIVLMNDGMSQDPWELVVETSKRLNESGAFRFGVALGQEVDLRELQLYTGGSDRIFRDGSTEKFLQEIENFLNRTQCELPGEVAISTFVDPQTSKKIVSCQKDLDVIIFLDSSNDQIVSHLKGNRYLALDIIGSLPMDDHIKVSLVSFAEKPIIVNDLKDGNSKEKLFNTVDLLQPRNGDPNYAAALEKGLEYFTSNRRPDVPGLFLIIGDGNTTNAEEELKSIQHRLKQVIDLTVISISNEKSVNLNTLKYLTGSEDRIFPFKQNSNFTKELRKYTDVDCTNPGLVPNVDVWDGSGSEITVDGAFQKDLALLKEDPFGESKSVSNAKPRLNDIHDGSLRFVGSYVPPLAIKKEVSKPMLNADDTSPLATDPPTTLSPFFNQGECAYDVLLLIDSSGSVVETFEREKRLALAILQHLPISPMNVRVAIIKFSSPAKVRTLHGFNSIQTKGHVLNKLESIRMSSGTTAIHSALQHAVNEYSISHGARPVKATPVAIVFTDGFGNKDFLKEATALRSQITDLFAVAINHEFPISRRGLVSITGNASKVFTEKSIENLHSLLRLKLKKCWF